MNINIKTVLILLTSIVIFCFSSCESSSIRDKKRAEVAKIIENKNCSDLLNDLYLAADGDEQSLARILNVTPSVINRVRNGKTKASIEFENEKFLLRLISTDDIVDLLKVYSDPDAVPFFNSDN